MVQDLSDPKQLVLPTIRRFFMATETETAVLAIFDEILNKIKSIRPLRTDGKELTTGFVYSQLVPGRMIDPRDYANPWSPMGGSSLQDAVNAANATSAAPAGDTPLPATDPRVKHQRAMQAAFRTAQLVNNMLMVTRDGSYLQYRTQRQVSFAYESIINGMQPTPVPPIPDEIQQQIDDAKKVLYELDEEGNIVGKSRLYKTYVKNADAYAKAKSDYADAQAAALANPARAETWPQNSVFYQRIVDQAWDDFKTMGAEKIERALDTIESVGVSMQARMIAKSREIYEAWNLGLTGVPQQIPYSYIEPTRWYDPETDEIGWQKLKITSAEYNHRSSSQSASNFQSNWESHSSSSSGGGSVGFAFWKASAEAGSSSSSSSFDTSSSSSSQFQFHNDAKNLTIKLEYGLCTIYRPWLLGDLFHLKNWYLVNNPKNAVSDGSIDNQIGKEGPLLPMIPSQFLVIRNVTIQATNWGSDSATFQAMHSNYRSESERESDYVSAGGGISLGFISFGGHGSHSSSDDDSNIEDSREDSSSDSGGWRFYENTLEIKGAQIIGWLSEIVPPCAPLDDPGLQ
jgi:hypothetical protein